MGWPDAIKEIASLLKKWGGAIAAFFAGRASVKRQNERAAHKATKKELEAEREAADLIADDSRLAELRERFKKR